MLLSVAHTVLSNGMISEYWIGMGVEVVIAYAEELFKKAEIWHGTAYSFHPEV